MKPSNTHYKKTQQAESQLTHLEDLRVRKIITAEQCENYTRAYQAQSAFPLFAEDIVTDQSLLLSVKQSTLKLETLAVHYKVSKKTIKNCRYLDLQTIKNEYEGLAEFIPHLDQLPSDYFPKAGQINDQKIFVKLLPQLNRLAKIINVSPHTLVKPFTKGWESGLSQIQKQSTYKIDVDLLVKEIIDMMNASYSYGIKPILEIEKLSDWYPLWFGAYGLKRLVKLSQEWKINYERFSLGRLKLSDKKQITWDALTSKTHAINTYYIHELTSQQELEQEGQQLDHCLGSYAEKCLKEKNFIYTLRNNKGESQSTFEVQYKKGDFELTQHKAYDNNEPTEAQKEAVDKFITRVLSTNSESDVKQLDQQKTTLLATLENKLYSSDTNEAQLSAEENHTLQELVAITHPRQAKKEGILAYLKSKLQQCVTEKFIALKWYQLFTKETGSLTYETPEGTKKIGYTCEDSFISSIDKATHIRINGDYYGTIFIKNGKEIYYNGNTVRAPKDAEAKIFHKNFGEWVNAINELLFNNNQDVHAKSVIKQHQKHLKAATQNN